MLSSNPNEPAFNGSPLTRQNGMFPKPPPMASLVPNGNSNIPFATDPVTPNRMKPLSPVSRAQNALERSQAAVSSLNSLSFLNARTAPRAKVNDVPSRCQQEGMPLGL